MNKDEEGFSVVEGLLILLVLAVVGFGGFYVWGQNNDKKVDTTTSNISEETSEPAALKKSVYDGWEEYCSPDEKSCFKYPSDWTYENEDEFNLTFTSPNGSVVNWTSAISGLGGACDANTDPHIFFNSVEPIPELEGYYVVESGYSASKNTGVAVVRNDTTPQTGDTGECLIYSYFDAKNSKFNNGKASAGLFANYDEVKDAEIQTVKNILLSYHY